MAWDTLTIQSGVLSPLAEAWDFLAVKSGIIAPYVPLPPGWDRLAVKSGSISPYVPPPPTEAWDFLAVKSGIIAPYVPLPPTGNATIAFTSTPSGAAVMINGAQVGITPTSYKIQPGTYTVLLKLTGYKDYTRKVTVAANQTQTVAATLVKVVAPTNWLPYVAIGGGTIGVIALVAVASRKKTSKEVKRAVSRR